MCDKQTGSKGKEIKRLWPKLHDRLTRGAETPGYAAWMGFARFVPSGRSSPSARERLPICPGLVSASKRQSLMACPERRFLQEKLRALLKAPARDSIRHKRIIAALPQAFQHPIKLRRGLETRKTASRCGEQFSGPSGSTNAWRRTDNVAKWVLYSLRLSEAVRSRRVVSLLRPSDEESPKG